MLGCLFGALLPAQKAPEPFSPSNYVNKFLPSWIRVGGENRTRFEGYSGLGFAPNQSDGYWLSRSRLSVMLLPKPWLHIYGEGQDSRAIGKQPGQPPYENVWDIHQAYVELGDMKKGRLAMLVGRQEMNLGDNRVIGAVNWTNANRTFDVVRGMVRLGDNRLEVFAASVVVNVNDTWDHHQQGNNIHGVYAELPKLIPHVNIQPYVLWRLQPRVKNEAGVVANLNEKIPGVRIALDLPRGLDAKVEMTREFGTLGSDRVQAWLGHWELGRTWKKWPLKPRLWGEYNFMSGDANAKDGIRGTYDPLYPTVHDKYGFADQFGGRNMKNVRWGAEMKLPRSVAGVLELNDWRLASPVDGIYTSQGAVIARSITGKAGTHVGNEVDFITTWKMFGPVQAGAGIGYILPGEFLKNTTAGKHYLYPYIMFTYKL